jgi:hypothetical protein
MLGQSSRLKESRRPEPRVHSDPVHVNYCPTKGGLPRSTEFRDKPLFLTLNR